MADSVTVAPEVYSVVFENARVRVLEIRTKPGQSMALHSHPDMVLYAVTDCDWRAGSESGETVDVHMALGETRFVKAVTHSAVSIGQADAIAIAIELK